MQTRPARVAARLQFQIVQMAEQATGEVRAESEVRKQEEAAKEHRKIQRKSLIDSARHCSTDQFGLGFLCRCDATFNFCRAEGGLITFEHN